jgi:N-acetylglutamate synthase-like GNAT family acetyltransferase
MTRNASSTIREFQSADVAALKSLIHRTIALCYPGHYCAEAVRFFMSYHNEEAIRKDAWEGCTVVLERAGRIVGTGTLVGDEIKRVFVDPAAQRLGAGRRIMRYLEDKARSSQVTTVKLDASLPSKAFYDRLGYATVEKTFLPVENGRRLDFFKMQKILTTASR